MLWSENTKLIYNQRPFATLHPKFQLESSDILVPLEKIVYLRFSFTVDLESII